MSALPDFAPPNALGPGIQHAGPAEVPLEILMRDLLMAELRHIGTDGIHYGGRCFVAAELSASQHQEVLIRYLPRIKDRIWVWDTDDHFICIARCTASMDLKERETFEQTFVRERAARLRGVARSVDKLKLLHQEERPASRDAEAPTTAEPEPSSPEDFGSHAKRAFPDLDQPIERVL